MPNPVLYKMDVSPPASAVMVLSDLIGLELDYKDVDFGKLEHKSPEYMKMNPMGTIPTLTDGDFVISDSNATMKYLLTKYGGEHEENLYPSDLQTRAIVDQCMFFNTGVFFIKLKAIALPAIFHGASEATAQQLQEIDSSYGVIEAYLENRRFIAADHLTIADIAAGMTAASFVDINPIDKDRYPRTAKWFEELNAIPAFRKYAKGPQQIGGVIKAAWQRNKK